MLRGLAGLNIAGGDLVEVAPAYDATANTRARRRADHVRDPEPDVRGARALSALQGAGGGGLPRAPVAAMAAGPS